MKLSDPLFGALWPRLVAGVRALLAWRPRRRERGLPPETFRRAWPPPPGVHHLDVVRSVNEIRRARGQVPPKAPPPRQGYNSPRARIQRRLDRVRGNDFDELERLLDEVENDRKMPPGTSES